MGGSYYDSGARTVRAKSLGYMTKSSDEIFTQSKSHRIHESMEPSKALLRESRDSVNHPNSVPIIIALDTTGSMGSIPNYLVKEGLPKLVSSIIQRGIPDPQILFLGVGDHECDRAPLQVGQFESGDEELDLWLTRTWLEKGGGGNEGESYLLAHYFAAKHTSIDSWEKRKQKGFLFTIGDEPGLRSLPKRSVQEIMGNEVQANFTDEQLLDAAKESYDVYHIHMTHGRGNSYGRAETYWKNLLNQHCIVVDEPEHVAETIADIIVNSVKNQVSYKPEAKVDNVITSVTPDTPKPTGTEEVIL